MSMNVFWSLLAYMPKGWTEYAECFADLRRGELNVFSNIQPNIQPKKLLRRKGLMIVMNVLNVFRSYARERN